jgi:hypothetical protein
MKKFIFLASGLVFLTTFLSAQFLVKEDLFSISFPSEPTRQVQDIETEGAGTVQMISYIYEDTTAAWMIAYSEYPAEYIQENELLENAKNGFVESLEVEVVAEWDITRDNYNGIYFQAESPSTFCIIKDYIVGNRLYQIGILKSDDYPTMEAIDKFMNSFNLNL